VKKVNWASIKQVYFLGIGGIGMSALARYFLAEGKTVAGYDRTSTPLTDNLKKEGMDIHFEDDINRIPPAFVDLSLKDQTLIVLTPAVPQHHTELNFFKDQEYQIAKRSQVLGFITKPHTCYGVAGTHGKTTTSSILAHILHTAGHNITAFLGGISSNYKSNLLLGNSLKPNHEIVVEADEYDRSFLTLFPDAAIITSMDADHLDIYGSRDEMHLNYKAFAAQVHPGGFIIHKSGLELGKCPARKITYSLTDTHANYVGKNIKVANGKYVFSLVTPAYVIDGLELGLPGRHNVENAVAASALAIEQGVDMVSLKEALKSYAGVQRRFEYHVRKENIIYIDDYAHHPEELKAAILSARELHPGKKIAAAFQPHLFTRTRDFVDGFAESLSLLDTLYLLEIYPARELPIPGVDSGIIFNKVTITDKHRISKEDLVSHLRKNKPEVFLTLGAGDIDQLVEPLKTLFKAV
jgi:UDP-N-acetylmuramate--alanine ligase